METMDKHEIDLFQDRLSRVIVKHYVKDIITIAEKYEKSFLPYYKILENIRENNPTEKMVAGGGFEPPSSGYPPELL